jgi:hypothetical protein
MELETPGEATLDSEQTACKTHVNLLFSLN